MAATEPPPGTTGPVLGSTDPSPPVPDARRTARPVSGADVARAAGVSPATVSYVMNGQDGVSEPTRRRILALAREMGYRRREGTGTPRPRRNHVIGLIVPNMINPMFPRWAHGVVESAKSIGYEVFLATTQDEPQQLAHSVRSLIARKVDGLILTSVPREDVAGLQLLRAARIPYVQLSRKSDFAPADFVGIDDVGAAAAVMEHVLGHGVRRVATVIGPRFSSASAGREHGFLAQAAATGVEVPLHWRISTTLNNLGGRMAAQELLQSTHRPEAVVCGSDEVAIGLMEYLMKQGVRVPEDILVTGYDGLPHSRSALVNLTTVVQPQIAMAQTSFEILQQRLDEPDRSYQTVILDHELAVGRTCGCPGMVPVSAASDDTRAPGGGEGGHR